MAAIHDLLAQVKDQALRERIEKEIDRLSKTKKFGLVFEEHMPECTPLYDVPVKKGGSVAKRGGAVNVIYEVMDIQNGWATCINKVTQERERIQVLELVTVAQFGEPVYPYLKPLASVCNAPESDLWHTLIEADNYHALQLLEYLYAGRVDCIYIDPPYNTGAKDWKYNNDYVDGADVYRHSKWLSMMEKRLRLAKKLLNPKESVLIVTIDEKEYLHLGCLLEEIFQGANMQMVSDVIHPSGVARTNQFSRVEEYIFFVAIGDAKPVPTTDTMLDFEMTGDYNRKAGASITWRRMIRAGSNSDRARSENCFYPIFVNEEKEVIESVGFPPGKGVDRNTVQIPEGCVAVWPMHSDGEEGVWQLSRPKFVKALEDGTAKLGRRNKLGQWAMNYLNQGMLKEIESGDIAVKGKDEKGALILERKSDKALAAKSVWNKKSHDATQYGSYLINAILGGKRFSYPKSLYSTHDAIQFFVADKPNALIVDFFAGSGTTLHAVNLMNAKDAGNRRCILVTNNEVSVAEAKQLSDKGFKPGDEEWNRLGIARYITWPRTVCSIKGVDVDGKPLAGDYLGYEHSMAEGLPANAAFFKLEFLDKTSIALGRQFAELIPLLWLKAGAHGMCPVLENTNINMLIVPENRFAVLVNERCFSEFENELEQYPEIDTLFFVTDSDAGYREMISRYQDKTTHQLYRDYLDNFRINTGR